MTDRAFLDTNVLVYLFDTGAPAKQARVQDYLARHPAPGQLILSTQVLQEFYVAVTRKLAAPVIPAEASQAVRSLATWVTIQVDTPLILSAIKRSQAASLSFWDALIIDAALVGGAACLYSEDFQDGQVIEGMEIVNPFTRGFRAPSAR